jgi:1-acyl-sn-glycerol-3-phosphate acyltransferase
MRVSGPGRKLVQLLVRGIFLSFFRVEVIGLGNIPSTPAIVCANHLGWADPILILLFFPIKPRIYVLGYHPAEISAFRTLVVDTLDVMVPLDRGRPRETLKNMEEVLNKGGSLLLFPEGTAEGGEEGKVRPFQRGVAHLAVMTGAPVLPVGITGTSELWLRRRLVLRVGKSIRPERFEGSVRERTLAITEAAEKAVGALLPGDRQRSRYKPLRGWLTRLFY